LIHLNLENFISDLKAALNKYVLELQSDSDIRRKALCWFSEYKIIGLAYQTSSTNAQHCIAAIGADE
jgi:hypothetical protein